MITDSDPKTKYQLKTVKNFLLSKFKSELFKKKRYFFKFLHFQFVHQVLVQRVSKS